MSLVHVSAFTERDDMTEPYWEPLAAAASPKITTGLLSAGPPVSPADGDIWIATNVDSGSRWQFQYDIGDAGAFKWKFIGGPPMLGASAGGVSNGGTLNTWLNIVATTLTIPRAGDYRVFGSCVASCPTIGTAYAGIYVGAVTNVAMYGNAGFTAAGGYTVQIISPTWRLNSLGAGQVCGLSGQGTVASITWQLIGWELLPIRVA